LLLTACQSSMPRQVPPILPAPIDAAPVTKVVVDEPLPYPTVEREADGSTSKDAIESAYVAGAAAYASAKLAIQSCLNQANAPKP
jgi:hypothetical protein